MMQPGFVIRGVGITAFAALVLLGVATHARLAIAQPGQMLEGSWIADVTNQATGTRQITLYTFMSDGTLISSNRDHPTRGPGHGAWVRTGDREFAITFVRIRFEADGSFIGTQKLRGQVTLSEELNAFTSRSMNEFYDVDGNLTDTNQTTTRATRIRVEPLP
jgi:hypothetical protein